MAETKIEWTDFTWNPWIGCTKVAPGCEHCYAEADQAIRRGRVKWGPRGTRSKTSADYWRQPLKWNRKAERDGVRRKVFCASLADVFEDWDGPILDHNGNPVGIAELLGQNGFGRAATMNDLRRDLFALIDATPHLDWLILSKRPENIRRMWSDKRTPEGHVWHAPRRPNVWLGTSISDQETADAAIPELLKCRDLAPVLFVSYEPALGPVDFSGFIATNCFHSGESHARVTGHHVEHRRHMPKNSIAPMKFWSTCLDCDRVFEDGTSAIDWLICGGESGSHARPCDVAWIRSAVEQCEAAEVPVFVKQLGARVHEASFDALEWPLKHPKGGDPAEWPEDLRVREFPAVEFACK